MALDDLVLLFDLQRWFHVKFKPADLHSIQTAGDLEKFILARVALTDDVLICPTATAFRELRTCIGREFGISAEEIQPRTPTVTLFRAKNPRVAWRLLGRSLDIHLRALQFPEMLFLPALAAAFLALLPTLAISLLNIPYPILVASAVGIPLSVLLLYLLERALSRFLPAEIPPHLRTLDGFAYVMVFQRQNSNLTWTRQQLWAAVQLLIAQSAFTSPRRIRRTTRLADV